MTMDYLGKHVDLSDTTLSEDTIQKLVDVFSAAENIVLGLEDGKYDLKASTKKIKDISVLYKGIITNDLDFFYECLIGNEIVDIKTKGKWLIFYLNDYCLLSHLRMEGKYFIKGPNEIRNNHEHVIFYLDDITLRYHDTRKFGKMYSPQCFLATVRNC